MCNSLHNNDVCDLRQRSNPMFKSFIYNYLDIINSRRSEWFWQAGCILKVNPALCGTASIENRSAYLRGLLWKTQLLPRNL
jgi:hypothetical protein